MTFISNDVVANVRDNRRKRIRSCHPKTSNCTGRYRVCACLWHCFCLRLLVVMEALALPVSATLIVKTITTAVRTRHAQGIVLRILTVAIKRFVVLVGSVSRMMEMGSCLMARPVKSRTHKWTAALSRKIQSLSAKMTSTVGLPIRSVLEVDA